MPSLMRAGETHGDVMRKRVVFIADSLNNAFKFQQILLELGVEIITGSSMQIRRILQPGSTFDLVIFESRESTRSALDEILSLAENHGYPLLVIAEERDVRQLRLPALVPSDFIVNGAGQTECSIRVKRLLGFAGDTGNANILMVDSMAINLDTYQVSVSGEPVDFTYLEYALLAFLVRHPDHTFSREALLQHVWGFDYYGGSRTVDVHVRRIRSKLGPNLAQHLETIRGVGYLWSSR